ncbi:MAG: hypothetical protein R3F42_05190 [Pseudomonadota bacterium]
MDNAARDPVAAHSGADDAAVLTRLDEAQTVPAVAATLVELLAGMAGSL